MKISIVQLKPDTGNIAANVEHHLKWIQRAIVRQANLVVFPELSLTGYEPSLAGELATYVGDPRFDPFQRMSDSGNIAVAVGLPLQTDAGVWIGMIIFAPQQQRMVYGKKWIHSDEKPYFVSASARSVFTINGVNVAPAICYESLLSTHSERASALGAEVYIASVAKSWSGIKKAYQHFPKVARKHSIPVLMSNGVGACDNFICAGRSAVWNPAGTLMGNLGSDGEGLLTYDTESHQIEMSKMGEEGEGKDGA